MSAYEGTRMRTVVAIRESSSAVAKDSLARIALFYNWPLLTWMSAMMRLDS